MVSTVLGNPVQFAIVETPEVVDEFWRHGVAESEQLFAADEVPDVLFRAMEAEFVGA